MSRILVVFLTLFTLFKGTSQTIPLVFEGCESHENPESCSLLELANIISREVPVSSLPYDLEENEELTLSLRLVFNEDGYLRPEWSIGYNSNKNSHEEFESVLEKIPLTLTAIKNKNEDRLSSFKSYMTFKNSSNRLTIKKIVEKGTPSQQIPEGVPIMKGCKAKWDNERIVKCNSVKFSKHFSSKFKMENLDSSFFVEGEKIEVKAVYYVETDGSLTVGYFDAPHESLYNEIKRVILEYKDPIQPGYIGSKNLRVIQNVPVLMVYHK